MDFDFAECLTVVITLLGATLFYAYVVFPLMMTIVGLRRRPTPTKPKVYPSVTLIIPAHNEEDVIVQKIESSLALDYPDLEIIVVSDGSTDQTVERAQHFDQIQLLAFAERRGKTSVLTDAVNAATGEVLCLCDANVMFHPDALWRLVSHLSDPDVGGVTGDVRLQSDESSFGFAESMYYRLERSIQQGESNLGSVIGVDGGMYVIRKELFCELPADTVLDDFSISMNVIRSGKKLLYEPTAVADENGTELAMDEFRRRVRIGVGAAQIIMRGRFPRWTQPFQLGLFFSHKFLRWISPWLAIMLLIAAIAWSFFNALALAIVLPMLAVIGLALIGTALPELRHHRFITLPFYLVLSEIAFAWGMVRGTLFKSSGIWQRTSRQPLLDENDE